MARNHSCHVCYYSSSSWGVDPLGSVDGSIPETIVGSVASSLLAQLTRRGFSVLTAKRNGRCKPEPESEELVMEINNVLVNAVLGIALDAGTCVGRWLLTGRLHN